MIPYKQLAKTFIQILILLCSVAVFINCVTFGIQTNIIEDQHPKNELKQNIARANFYYGYDHVDAISKERSSHRYVFPNSLYNRVDNFLTIEIGDNDKEKVDLYESSEFDKQDKKITLILTENIAELQNEYLSESNNEDLLILIPIRKSNNDQGFKLYYYKAYERSPLFERDINKDNIKLTYDKRNKSLSYIRYFLYPFTIVADIVLIPLYAIFGIAGLIALGVSSI